MNFYPSYLKERESLETLESQHGFALYKISGDECYLQDIYVVPEMRKSGVAASLADQVSEIAKGRGCRWLTGSVCPSANNSHTSLLILLAYSMTLKKADTDIIYFSKRIS